MLLLVYHNAQMEIPGLGVITCVALIFVKAGKQFIIKSRLISLIVVLFSNNEGS